MPLRKSEAYVPVSRETRFAVLPKPFSCEGWHGPSGCAKDTDHKKAGSQALIHYKITPGWNTSHLKQNYDKHGKRVTPMGTTQQHRWPNELKHSQHMRHTAGLNER